MKYVCEVWIVAKGSLYSYGSLHMHMNVLKSVILIGYL